MQYATQDDSFIFSLLAKGIKGDLRIKKAIQKSRHIFISKLSFLLLLFLICLIFSSEAEEYVIKPGDTISILVLGRNEYNQSIPVRPDGRISYPFLGEIKVDGMTTTELADKIRTELLKYLLDPQVSVIIAQSKKNEVSVLGQVKSPNLFRFDEEKISLLKAISMAGGIIDDTADLRNVKIISDDGTSKTIDLEELIDAETQNSVLLLPGDVVYIPFKKNYILVTGYVKAPGEYKTKKNISSSHAIALAGGPVEDLADLKKALIVRSTGEIINIDLTVELSSDNKTEEFSLFPGDTLYIPSAYQEEEVKVIGYVRNSGRYKVKKPLFFFEALTAAGGIVDTREADLKKALIIRNNGRIEPVDLTALQKPNIKDISALNNIKLYPGDTLEIPQKKKLINWSLALTIVTIISLSFSIINNLTSK